MNIKGRVTYAKGNPVANAKITLSDKAGTTILGNTQTDERGYYILRDVAKATYTLGCTLFGDPQTISGVTVKDQDIEVPIAFDGLTLQPHFLGEQAGIRQSVTAATAGKRLVVQAEFNSKLPAEYRFTVRPDTPFSQSNDEITLVVPGGHTHLYVDVVAIEQNEDPAYIGAEIQTNVLGPEIQTVDGEVGVKGRIALQEPVGVRLQRTASDPTLDQALWVAIRNRTRALSFDRYQRFMNRALQWEEREGSNALLNRVARELDRDVSELGANLHGVSAYQTLKLLTETFLLLECGVRLTPGSGLNRVSFDPSAETRRLGRPFSPDDLAIQLREYLGDRAQLPYITRVVKAAFPEFERDGADDRLIAARINEPCLIELIWSYWMEEGMLVQTMNAVSQRFQNVRSAGDRDPLANLEIDPLRPLNNLLWGFIQDELNRLSVRRRAYEYTHHYGLTIYGKAASGLRTAESRSKFLEAFHNLLYQTSVFFKEDFQTTVIADGFPLLTSLREVHLILAQGAHNQFGDLPWTARVEMMLMQFMLARPEIHDFLQARAMVPYREPWEAQVDAMKNLQGWTDVTVSHFRDLAVYGEQLLLSIRYGDWIADNDEYSAINWARYFRPEVQGYLHAYRAVTGIDLTNADTVDATIPGLLLRKRMAGQQRVR
jgi:Carboxypeptidase regulatory-like domain